MNDNNAHFWYVNYIFYQSTSKDRNADEINSADYQKIKNGCRNGCRHFGKVRKKQKKNTCYDCYELTENLFDLQVKQH